jgi:hypothetical protein
MLKKLAGFLVAASVGALASTAAFAVATPVDVTAVTDQISAALTPINFIGGGVLLIVVGFMVYKWIRRAF